ncbi:hypothetical protein SAMN05216436_10374 [bacterium A37T11]|nr:hypothetical protein SAMN05216436_10374 [bacterium A37T11]
MEKNLKIDFSHMQVTGGTVNYLNGISGFKKYGLKGMFGVIDVHGDDLKYFKTTPDVQLLQEAL